MDIQNIFSVKDKVVALTGAGGVLCGEMARALGQAGAKVAVLDLNEEAANKVADEINANNGTAAGIKCDVLDKESLQKAYETTKSKLGDVDVLINGAGGNSKKATTSDDMSFFDIPPEGIRFVFDLNLLGTVLATQVFAREMAQKGDGIVINISSMTAFRPLTKVAAYGAAKAAVSNFTQWLAVHMCQNYSKKIRVNAIAPGFFITEQNRFLVTDKETGDYTPRGQSIVDHTPMDRFGEADELIGTLIWLLSDASKFVTGIVVPVDGGYSAFGGV